jgi:hypothetical protein
MPDEQRFERPLASSSICVDSRPFAAHPFFHAR